MKATELMIGDWVQNTNGDKGKVIGFDYHTNIKSNEIVIAYSDNSTCWSCSIEPIPLTALIMEKNGWKENKWGGWYKDDVAFHPATNKNVFTNIDHPRIEYHPY